MISLRSVTKRFAGATSDAVHELSLDVFEGEVVVLVGPSGCGKTTTMRMINRLIEPTSGQVVVEGTDVLKRDPVELRRGIGYVIQTVGLMPHRTVAQNIATVPDLLGWEQARTRERVDEMAALLELDPELLARYPSELSGGQRQRAGVARALAADPPVMLMDEPFAAVDPVVRSRLQDQFLDIQRRLRKTIVFVTHDIDEAIKMADRIAILNVGGIVEQHAPPEEVLRIPASAFVADFVGEERGLKRLGLIAVRDVEVQPGPAPADAPIVGDDQTMRQALDVLVDNRLRRRRRDGTGRGASRRPHPRADLERVGAVTMLAAEPLIRWDWVGDHLSEIGSRLIEHLELTIIAVVIGFAISFPLAVLAHRRRWTYAPVTWAAGILYTIPSLSLFVILIPITGLSATTVAIGLVSYTLLILIRNTTAGLAGVPADVVDSAVGMGSRPDRCSGTWRFRSRCR